MLGQNVPRFQNSSVCFSVTFKVEVLTSATMFLKTITWHDSVKQLGNRAVLPREPAGGARGQPKSEAPEASWGFLSEDGELPSIQGQCSPEDLLAGLTWS